jgi:hypothetical protein
MNSSINSVSKNKKLITCLACAAATTSLLLLSVSENAKTYRLNAGYTSSHSLTMMSGQNAPTNTSAYQITDSSMNLHTGGYVYAQVTNTGTPSEMTTLSPLTFGDSNFLVTCASGKNGDYYASYVTIDVWANGITKVDPTFSDGTGLPGVTIQSHSFKIEAYTNGGYPTQTEGVSPVETHVTDGFDSPATITTAGVNHIRLILYSVFTPKADIGLSITSLIVEFSC